MAEGLLARMRAHDERPHDDRPARAPLPEWTSPAPSFKSAENAIKWCAHHWSVKALGYRPPHAPHDPQRNPIVPFRQVVVDAAAEPHARYTIQDHSRYQSLQIRCLGHERAKCGFLIVLRQHRDPRRESEVVLSPICTTHSGQCTSHLSSEEHQARRRERAEEANRHTEPGWRERDQPSSYAHIRRGYTPPYGHRQYDAIPYTPTRSEHPPRTPVRYEADPYASMQPEAEAYTAARPDTRGYTPPSHDLRPQKRSRAEDPHPREHHSVQDSDTHSATRKEATGANKVGLAVRGAASRVVSPPSKNDTNKQSTEHLPDVTALALTSPTTAHAAENGVTSLTDVKPSVSSSAPATGAAAPHATTSPDVKPSTSTIAATEDAPVPRRESLPDVKPTAAALTSATNENAVATGSDCPPSSNRAAASTKAPVPSAPSSTLFNGTIPNLNAGAAPRTPPLSTTLAAPQAAMAALPSQPSSHDMTSSDANPGRKSEPKQPAELATTSADESDSPVLHSTRILIDFKSIWRTTFCDQEHAQQDGQAPILTTASTDAAQAARAHFLGKVNVQLRRVDPLLRKVGATVEARECHLGVEGNTDTACECAACPWLVDESAMPALLDDFGAFINATASPLQLVFVFDALYTGSGGGVSAVSPHAGAAGMGGLGLRASGGPRRGHSAAKRSCWRARLHSSIDVPLWFARNPCAEGRGEIRGEGAALGELDIYRIEEIHDERQRPCVIRWL